MRWHLQAKVGDLDLSTTEYVEDPNLLPEAHRLHHDLTGWQSNGANSTITHRTTDPPPDTHGYMRLVTNVTATTRAETDAVGMVPVTPGESVTFGVWVRNVSGARTVRAALVALSSTGAALESWSSLALVPGTEWEWREVTGTAPAGTTHMDLRVNALSGAIGDTSEWGGPEALVAGRVLQVTPAVLPQLLEVRVTDELDTERRCWPLRRGPSTANLSVLMETAADAAEIGTTTPVVLRYYTDHLDTGAEPAWTFHGTTSDPVIRPHDRGVVVTLTCADYLAGLGQYTVGSSDWPAEDTEARINRMFAAVGITPPWLPPESSASYEWPVLAARAAGAVSLLAEAQATLDQSALELRGGETNPWGGALELFELRPMFRDELDPVDGDLTDWRDTPNPLQPWEGVVLEDFVESPAPGVLREVGGVWVVEFDPAADRGHAVIPAGATSFDSTWNRRAGSDVNTLDVVWDGGKKVTRTSNKPDGAARVTERVEAPYLTTALDAADLGAALIPAYVSTEASWEADTFTVYLEHAPEGWWPRHVRAYDDRPGVLRAVMVLDGLQARHAPEGVTWWAGVLAFHEVTMTPGRVRLDLGLLARGITEGEEVMLIGSGNPIHAETLPAGLTYANVDPDITLDTMTHVGTWTT